MNKHLVLSEKEYLDLFKDWDIIDAENVLGVQFAFKDGSYDEGDGTKEVSRSIYRNLSDYASNFPKHYPCVVILVNDKSWDRVGNLHVQFVEFVYTSDFSI